jgi:hypothetical protein
LAVELLDPFKAVLDQVDRAQQTLAQVMRRLGDTGEFGHLPIMWGRRPACHTQ